MKIAVSEFPTVARFHSNPENPAFITGVGQIFRDPNQAGIFKPGWQALEYYRPEAEPQTPEQLKAMLKSLLATGVIWVNLTIDFEHTQPLHPDFRVRELI